MPEKQVSEAEIRKYKQWALIQFRKMLRGNRITEQVRRWATGELGAEYRFQIEFAFNEEAANFVNDPRNVEVLGSERIEE